MARALHLNAIMFPRWLEIAVGVASVAMFVGTIAAVPWLLVRIPSDYFVRQPSRGSVAKSLLRNVAGAVLVGLGVAMLVLPGQGLLTILLGLSVLDFPAKRRWMRHILCREKIRAAVQKLRARAHRPPLDIPDAP